MEFKIGLVNKQVNVRVEKIVEKRAYLCPFCDHNEEETYHIKRHVIDKHTYTEIVFSSCVYNATLYKFDSLEKLNLFMELCGWLPYKGEFITGWAVFYDYKMYTINEYLTYVETGLLKEMENC